MTTDLLGNTDYMTPDFRIGINMPIFGVSWIIPLIIAVLSMVLVTRNPDKLKKIALPMFMGWHLLGISQSLVVIIIAGIIYLSNELMFQGPTNPLTIFTTAVKQHDKSVLIEQQRLETLNKGILRRRKSNPFSYSRLIKQDNAIKDSWIKKFITQRENSIPINTKGAMIVNKIPKGIKKVTPITRTVDYQTIINKDKKKRIKDLIKGLDKY